MRPIQHHKIAVIGGGLSGTLAALNLIKSGTSASILLFEKNPARLFRGVAYSGTLPYQPLNVVVGRMSLFSKDPEHFWRWIQAHREQYGTALSDVDLHAFVDRRIYGDYVQDTFQQEAGDRVQRVQEGVVGLTSGEQGCEVKCASGQSFLVDRVVLAWGNLQPKLPLPLREVPGIVADPWSAETAQRIQPEDDVLLVGTGLTMVDWAVSLAQKGHKGRIIALSRHGKLPRPHAPHGNWPAPETWPKSLPELLGVLRAEARKADAAGVSWIGMMDGIRDSTASIWQQLNVEERQRFLRHLVTLWDIHRHRMPGASWAHLEALRENGQFALLAGRIQACQPDASGGFSFSYVPRGTNSAEHLQVRHVINCTGPESDIANMQDPLISDLYAQGLIARDALGLGLWANHTGHPLKKDGAPWEEAIVLGSLRRAELWESTALREIREQAEQLGRYAPDWTGAQS